jgi:hypothetical protein
MKIVRKLLSLVCMLITLNLCMVTAPGHISKALAQIGTTQINREAVPKPSQIVNKPDLPPGIPQDDGKITNVTTIPAGLWHTGTTVKIQWQWPGFVGFLADVTLWSGSQQVGTIVSGWNNTWVSWKVPINFSPGTYTLRVQSSKNQTNFSDTAVRIENSTLSIMSPKAGQIWTAGTTNQVVWTYQGNPGPLKIELIPVSGGSALLIANNIPCGNLGAGSFNWLIPAAITAGSYQIKVTSTGNNLITAGQTFSVQKLGTVGIIVTDPDNVPIDGATVTTNLNGTSLSVVTQPNGQAVFGMLPAATYNFTAIKQGFLVDGTNQTQVVLANGATQSAVIKLQRGLGKVIITVKDGASPIEGMGIVIGVTEVGKYHLSTYTKSDGTATFDSVKTGTWEVHTQAYPYNLQHQSPHYVDLDSDHADGEAATPMYVTVTPGSTTTATIFMKRYGWANITVTDGAMPVYNAVIGRKINSDPNDTHYGLNKKTDATGTVKFEVEPGVRWFVAWMNGYKRVPPFSVNITGGGTTNLTIPMTKE